MSKLRIISLALASTGLAACGSFVHRIDVQQGNVIEQAEVNALKPGMTRRQVGFLLGAPLLVDAFHPDRWDYVYTLEQDGEPIEERRLTLWFREDALTRIEGDLQPQPDAAPVERRTEPLIVPPQPPRDRGVLSALWDFITPDAPAETAADSSTP